RRCCRTIGCSAQGNSDRGKHRGARPWASEIELRNKRHRLCDRRPPRESDPHVVAKNVNVDPFELPSPRLWLSRVSSYLRPPKLNILFELPSPRSWVSRVSYLRAASERPPQRSCSSNRVGRK